MGIFSSILFIIFVIVLNQSIQVDLFYRYIYAFFLTASSLTTRLTKKAFSFVNAIGLLASRTLCSFRLNQQVAPKGRVLTSSVSVCVCVCERTPRTIHSVSQGNNMSPLSVLRAARRSLGTLTLTSTFARHHSSLTSKSPYNYNIIHSCERMNEWYASQC